LSGICAKVVGVVAVTSAAVVRTIGRIRDRDAGTGTLLGVAEAPLRGASTASAF
jgi:hypothetical protein